MDWLVNDDEDRLSGDVETMLFLVELKIGVVVCSTEFVEIVDISEPSVLPGSVSVKVEQVLQS